ncbi:O-antigen ligase family protein [Parabacteroides johnsonii]|jgi:hypothetical protein|uniref:O-antigen ligase family protein n=1 Tax=Parabacteroides johnsonii TaxID=387661 RepID=UPI001896CE1F|nr:O-antigen ligase family protein [Parabacteroides johnsonii]
MLFVTYLLFSVSFLYFRFVPPVTSSPFSDYHPQYVNSIYYVVCMLPFLLCYEKKTLYFVIGLICVMASGKQGAFVGLTVAGVIYYIIDIKMRGQAIFSKMIFSIIFLSVLPMVMYSYLSKAYSMDILGGFETMVEDGGNGRMEIYEKILNLFYNSETLEMIFGHGGLGSVSKTLGISAHNDFLEVLFDFGIVGILLYFSIILKLFFVGLRFVRDKFQLAPAFMFSIVLFIVLSMISHLVFILKYAMFLFSFWGYCLNKYVSYEKKNCSNSSY